MTSPAHYDFKQRGDWDPQNIAGNVQRAPLWIHRIVVDSVHAIWQSSYKEEDKEVSKNHMAWHMYFAEEQEFDITPYKGAILSMEVDFNATEADTFEKVSALLRCGSDYYPGTFSVKMLTYQTETFSAAYTREYKIKQGSTLGQFIKPILARRMDEFLFHIYIHERDTNPNPRNSIKGCGHFSVLAYIVWIEEHLITDAHSVEEPHSVFSLDTMRTYLPNGKFTEAGIGRGEFLNITDLTLDEPHPLAPEHIWSVGRTRAACVLAGEAVGSDSDDSDSDDSDSDDDGA